MLVLDRKDQQIIPPANRPARFIAVAIDRFSPPLASGFHRSFSAVEQERDPPCNLNVGHGALVGFVLDLSCCLSRGLALDRLNRLYELPLAASGREAGGAGFRGAHRRPERLQYHSIRTGMPVLSG